MDFRIDIIKADLINVGASEDISVATTLVEIFPVKSSGAYHIYDLLDINSLSDLELIQIFKGLVIAEKKLDWHCGSTTPAAHIYQHITLRNLDFDYALADWAFQYSDNEYIPFGSRRHGERTAYEYIQWVENYHRRIAQEAIDASIRKRQRLEKAKIIAENKRIIDSKNRELYHHIMQNIPSEQINIITRDSTHNILFYMPIITNLLNRTDIESKSWDKLLDSICSLKMTPFNKRLIKAIAAIKSHSPI